jgi:hypothetical protein
MRAAVLWVVLAVLVMVAMAGCGGGDPEDEAPDQATRPPACQANPKACT